MSPYHLCLAVALSGCDMGEDQSGSHNPPPVDTLALKIPSLNGASTLDVGTWNIEWFGNSGNGPTNEALQLSTVRSALLGMKLDVIGLQEVTSQTQWDELERGLPGYTGFLAVESSVVGGRGSYDAGEQKVGILYRSSVATLVGARIVLASHDFSFAGRPPLEVTLRVTLDGVTQNVIVLVLHMKAFSDAESWQRRVDASVALKAFLDVTYPTQRVIVLGDWNDDLDVSISPGRRSPYDNFVADPLRYAFPTLELSVSRVPTTVGFADAIDHHLVSNELAALVQAGSVRVVRLDQVIAGYAQITSDHYPVVVSYRMR